MLPAPADTAAAIDTTSVPAATAQASRYSLFHRPPGRVATLLKTSAALRRAAPATRRGATVARGRHCRSVTRDARSPLIARRFDAAAVCRGGARQSAALRYAAVFLASFACLSPRRRFFAIKRLSDISFDVTPADVMPLPRR